MFGRPGRATTSTLSFTMGAVLLVALPALVIAGAVPTHPAAPTGPPSVASAMAPGPLPGTYVGNGLTYDAGDGYYLLETGGTKANQNQTWEFVDGVWKNLSLSATPPISNWACMTYDWADGYVLWFGGGYHTGIGTANGPTNYTWTYRAGVWTNITVTAGPAPPPVVYPSCTYDAAPGDGFVVLFGGAVGLLKVPTGSDDHTVVSTNQTWKFSHGKWTNITSYHAPHPAATYGQQMAYDGADGYVVLYGGAQFGTSTGEGQCSEVQCPHLNYTWKFVGGSWTNISSSASVYGTPPGRWEIGMTNGSVGGGLLTFGGQNNGYKSWNSTYNYTWQFLGGVWTNISSIQSSTPATRFGPVMAYDPFTGVTLMFGGWRCTLYISDGCIPQLNDTWYFSGNEWTNATSGADRYSVTFRETGLPSGTSWSITLGPSLASTTTNTLNFTELNGTYPFAISIIPGWRQTTLPYSGTVNFSGANVTEPTLAFVRVAYTIDFTESGPPSGTEWWVNLTNGQTFNSTGSSLAFSEPNGTYDYSPATTDKSYASAGGIFTVNGMPVSETVTFKPFTYAVTFTETGLPSGTTWSVTIGSQTAGSNTRMIVFDLVNGTYSYRVNVVPGYRTASPSGAIKVSGAPVKIGVPFKVTTYVITLTEKGLPSHTAWNVTLTPSSSASITLSSTTTTIKFSEPNGTYAYAIATVSGYQITTGSYTGSITVSGTNPATDSVHWTQVKYTVKFTETGLPKGTSWSVSIDVSTKSTTGGSVSFSLSNGTYPFTIAALGYVGVSNPPSPLTVDGATVDVDVTFS